MEVGAAGTRSAYSGGVERVVCCLMNRANKFTAGGLLTKFIKRGLEASQCAAVGRYMEAAKQKSSKAKERRERGEERKRRGGREERRGWRKEGERRGEEGWEI